MPPTLDVWRDRASGCEAYDGTWRGFSTTCHAHDDCQVTLVRRGVGLIRYRGVERPVAAGELAIFASQELHAIGATARPWTFSALHLPRAAVLEALARHGQSHLPAVVAASAPVAAAFTALHAAIRAGVVDRELAAFADLLARTSGSRDSGRGALAPPVAAAREHLDARLDRVVPLAELAGVLALSPTYLARRFSSEVGTAPHAYHLQARIGLARRLLRQGQSPISAALAAGFADQSHFTRHFTRAVGMTPARYRRAVSGQGKNVPDAGRVRP